MMIVVAKFDVHGDWVSLKLVDSSVLPYLETFNSVHIPHNTKHIPNRQTKANHIWTGISHTPTQTHNTHKLLHLCIEQKIQLPNLIRDFSYSLLNLSSQAKIATSGINVGDAAMQNVHRMNFGRNKTTCVK